MKTAVFSVEGDKVSDIELKSEVFASKVNEGLIHQVVRAELMNTRSGNAATKTRAEVSGGGVKPWRQKGTGRARAGSIRSPLFVGGGIVFGPRPKNYSVKVPKKMKKAALRSVLSAKAKDKEIIIIDKIDFKEPKTKQAKDLLTKLKVIKKCAIVLEKADENTIKSFRNLPNVNVLGLDNLSSYALLNNEVLIFTKEALQKITEVLAS